MSYITYNVFKTSKYLCLTLLGDEALRQCGSRHFAVADLPIRLPLRPQSNFASAQQTNKHLKIGWQSGSQHHSSLPSLSGLLDSIIKRTIPTSVAIKESCMELSPHSSFQHRSRTGAVASSVSVINWLVIYFGL